MRDSKLVLYLGECMRVCVHTHRFHQALWHMQAVYLHVLSMPGSGTHTTQQQHALTARINSVGLFVWQELTAVQKN
jgi:hypothetical protein